MALMTQSLAPSISIRVSGAWRKTNSIPAKIPRMVRTSSPVAHTGMLSSRPIR